MRYELYYWPGIQGRGELVRLALEAGGAEYVDVARRPARQGGGMPALARVLKVGAVADRPTFALPALRAGRLVIGQAANILEYLGPRLGLVPRAEADRSWVHQLQLTLADLIVEIHDTHHPVGVSLYYEEQRAEALRRALDFRSLRLGKFLGYFEGVLQRAGHGWLVGRRPTYADLSLFQVIAGLRYAFPQAMQACAKRTRRLADLHDRVGALRRVRAYLDSPRRLPFSDADIWRHYPELDA
jgi:glutathione S-transferase